MLVGTANRYTSIHRCRKVKHLINVLRKHGYRKTVQPKSRYSSIGIHQQPDVCIRLVRDLRQQPSLPPARPTLLLLQYSLPPLELFGLDLVIVLAKAPLDRNLRRMVPVKEGRVDFHTLDASARDAEPDHHPIERLGVMPSRFPAVVPRARMGVHARFANRRGRRDQVVGGGEPFVGEGEDARTQRFGDEVCVLQDRLAGG